MMVVDTQDVVYGEVACVKSGAGESPSLLGPLGRSMRLKVSRDKPRASHIVELASRRCLVGSASNCDVRVDEPGVAPIACLIFHGAKNNVVRWLDSSQDFAGGELFQDEVLCAGDPLQIGPVELELLVDEIMAAEEPAAAGKLPETSEDRLAEYILRLERLELQLVELQHASEATASLSNAAVSNSIASNHEVAATISGLAAQLADLQSRSVTDRDLWAVEKEELEALLQKRLREFDLLQEEVQRLRDELVTVRSEYANVSANHDASERLAEVSQQLAARTEEFEHEQASWESDRNDFQRQLQQHMERLEQFETQLADQSTRQAESEAARQDAEARADRLQESVEELSARLAEQQADYDAVRAAWEADREALESELAETKQQLAESAAAESAGIELREIWDRERAELKSQVAQAISRAEEVQAELEAQRRQLEEQAQSHCKSQPADLAFDPPSEAIERPSDCAISAAPDNPMDRLLAGSLLVHDGGDEFDEPMRDFTSTMPMTRDDGESDYPNDCYSDGEYGHAADEASCYHEPVFGGLQSAAYLNDETESAADESEEVAFEAAAPDPPVSTADVFARLGQSHLLSDDETDDAQLEQPQDTPVNETPFAAPIALAASETGDDEESIEAYMSRLMNRVRGTDDRDEPRQRVEPTIERSPVTEYTEVAKVPRPAPKPEAEKFNPEEYKPRSQAPEMADRMTAMRSLANDSARTAIASHAKRSWSSVMQLKLLVSVFAFVCVVASLFFFWGDFLLMTLGSLVGVGVLAYWTRNAITYRKLLLDSLMLDPEGGDCDGVSSDEDYEDSNWDEDAASGNAR